MKTELEKARESINSADKKMAEAFYERMKASEAIAKYKFENNLPIFDEKREKEVISKNSALIKDEIILPYYISFLKNNMNISKEYQKKLIEEMKSGEKE